MDIQNMLHLLMLFSFLLFLICKFTPNIAVFGFFILALCLFIGFLQFENDKTIGKCVNNQKPSKKLFVTIHLKENEQLDNNLCAGHVRPPEQENHKTPTQTDTTESSTTTETE